MEDSEQSVWFEMGMEEFTSGSFVQLLHGGTIHEPSRPASSTAVNTCVKTGANDDTLQRPAITEESLHGIAVGTSSLTVKYLNTY